MVNETDSPRVPTLAHGDVHIWWYASPAIAPRVRRRYVDALLRTTLSRYVGIAPQALRFGREQRGRPFLLDVDAAPDFNLSDTDGGTVVAVARGLRVGIDLERLDRQPRVKALAARYFRKEEATEIDALDGDAAQRAFLYAWTAKESSCKATGTGIYGWLDQWGFACDALGGDPDLISAPAEAGPVSCWSHRRIAPSDGYTAVIACKGAIHGTTLLVSDEAHAIAAWAHETYQSG